MVRNARNYPVEIIAPIWPKPFRFFGSVALSDTVQRKEGNEP